MLQRQTRFNHKSKNARECDRERAVIIGGSLAGLLAARVLSAHFREVVIIERDAVGPEPLARKGQKHTLHTHILLNRGLQILDAYFPQLVAALEAKGAQLVDFTSESEWYVGGGVKRRHKSGIEYLLASRPLLEAKIREMTIGLSNVCMIPNASCKSLVMEESSSRVVAVQIESRGEAQSILELRADLVVDASGRGSRTPKWLEQAGYEAPLEEQIQIDVGYATRVYQRPTGQSTGGGLVLVQPVGPDESKGGCLVPIEGDRWICTLSGWGGDHASSDPADFDRFATELPSPALRDATKSLEPVGEIVTYKYPMSRWRRYDRLRSHPTGLIAIGDAVCSFNPIFGQGMTSAACQAEVLDQLLTTGMSPDYIWKPFYRRCAYVINRAWETAAAGDFQFRTTTGKKPRRVELINRYVAAIQKACHRDPVVYVAYLNVTNLNSSPHSLLRPNVLMRVAMDRLRSALFGRHSKKAYNHLDGQQGKS